MNYTSYSLSRLPIKLNSIDYKGEFNYHPWKKSKIFCNRNFESKNDIFSEIMSENLDF